MAMKGWRKISQILPEDQKLCKQAFKLVKGQPRPMGTDLAGGYEPEIEFWEEIAISPASVFVRHLSPSRIYCLSPQGFAFFAPILLAATLLDPEGSYADTLFREMRRNYTGFCSLFDDAGAELSLQLLDRIAELILTSDPEQAELYGGLAAIHDPANMAFLKTVALVRNRIARCQPTTTSS